MPLILTGVASGTIKRIQLRSRVAAGHDSGQKVAQLVLTVIFGPIEWTPLPTQ